MFVGCGSSFVCVCGTYAQGCDSGALIMSLTLLSAIPLQWCLTNSYTPTLHSSKTSVEAAI